MTEIIKKLEHANYANNLQKDDTLFLWHEVMGFANHLNLKKVKIAMALAEGLHDGQYRRSGAPYIIHPLNVTYTLISMGITDEDILAASLLHDVVEDCGVSADALSIFNISTRTIDIIKKLSKTDKTDMCQYFLNIIRDPAALIVKLSDRYDNTTDIVRNPKREEYQNETSFFLDLCGTQNDETIICLKMMCRNNLQK